MPDEDCVYDPELAGPDWRNMPASRWMSVGDDPAKREWGCTRCAVQWYTVDRTCWMCGATEFTIPSRIMRAGGYMTMPASLSNEPLLEVA